MPRFGAGNGLSHVAFFCVAFCVSRCRTCQPPFRHPKKYRVSPFEYIKRRNTHGQMMQTCQSNARFRNASGQTLQRIQSKRTKAENIRKSRLARIQQTMCKPWPRPHALAVQENFSAKVPEQIQAGGSRSFSILSTPGCNPFAFTKKYAGKRPV